MDYCSPCSRTLNGAVTCPECGAYDPAVAQPSGRGDGAPAVEAALPEPRLEPRFVDGSNSPGSLPPGSPTVSMDLPGDRYDRPAPLKKYAVRSLAAAAFTLLGGLGAATVFSPSTAPRAASVPDRSSPEEPGADVPDPQASPERASTHPARKGVRDSRGDDVRRPLPASRGTAPTSRPSATPTPSASPTARATPSPRASSSSRRPSSPPRTAAPSTRPSASPSASASGSTSASPTGSGSPSSTGEAGG